jgi:hypothetical protein
MKIEIAQEIEDDASLTIAVGRINYILLGIVTNVTDQVMVRWDLAGDLKARNLFLKLWYEDQGASTTIDPKELDDSERLTNKLRDLWGDLLQVRIDRSVRRMNSLVREEVGS